MIDKNQRLEEEILGLKNKIKYLEEQLHEAKNFINELYSIYDGLIVHLDTNGKVVAISDSIEKITGYKKEEIIGKNWFETLVPPPNISLYGKYLLCFSKEIFQRYLKI